MSGEANFRGAGLMVASMAMFAVEDAFLKALAGAMPVGQVLVMTGALATPLVVFWAALRGRRIGWAELRRPIVLLRSASEGVVAALFVAALGLGDLSSAAAILQAMPLAVTMGAALFLGQKVGWRRWLSIAVGLVGVLMIMRPGSAAFQPASLLAVGAVAVLALRDLLTRAMPEQVSSTLLTAAAFAAVVPAGLIVGLIETASPVTPDMRQTMMLIGAVGFGLVGYQMVVAATRIGDVAAIAPFRYARLVFALILAVLLFRERPDTMTLAGAGVIVASGIYTMAREARLRRQAARAHRAATGKTGG